MAKLCAVGTYPAETEARLGRLERGKALVIRTGTPLSTDHPTTQGWGDAGSCKRTSQNSVTATFRESPRRSAPIGASIPKGDAHGVGHHPSERGGPRLPAGAFGVGPRVSFGNNPMDPWKNSRRMLGPRRTPTRLVRRPDRGMEGGIYPGRATYPRS